MVQMLKAYHVQFSHFPVGHVGLCILVIVSL